MEGSCEEVKGEQQTAVIGSHSDIMTMHMAAQDEGMHVYMNQSADFSTDRSDSLGRGVEFSGKIKRTRVGLSAKCKREICLYKQCHPNATQEKLVQFCKDRWNLRVGRTTLGEIIKAKEKWLSITPEQESIRRRRKGRHQQLEVELFKWISALKKADPSINISDQMILDHAKIMGDELNIDKSFSYSNGWLLKFKKRHGIKNRYATEKFNMLVDNYSSKEPYSSQSVLYDVNSSGGNPENVIGNTGSTSMTPYWRPDDTQAQAMSPNISNITDMFIKEEYIEECENSDETHGIGFNSAERSLVSSGSLYENETRPHTETKNMQSPPAYQDQQCSKCLKTSLTKLNSRVITASEAKKGALQCIRYLENHPVLGEHLDQLWNIYDAIEEHQERDEVSQTTIKQYFSVRGRRRSKVSLNGN